MEDAQTIDLYNVPGCQPADHNLRQLVRQLVGPGALNHVAPPPSGSNALFPSGPCVNLPSPGRGVSLPLRRSERICCTMRSRRSAASPSLTPDCVAIRLAISGFFIFRFQCIRATRREPLARPSVFAKVIENKRSRADSKNCKRL